MRLLPYLLVSAWLCAESDSMLAQAEAVSKQYAHEVAKAAPPSLCPQTDSCLEAAPVWFTIDLRDVAPCQTVFQALQSEFFWDVLKDVGARGVRLIGLKQGGAERTGLGLDPAWGSEEEWTQLSSMLQKKGLALIGDAMTPATGLNGDFALALKNVGDYPSLYHLIEIDKSDWKLLPPVPKGQTTVNIPWLALQDLHKKGYVPERYSPFVKESEWNATSRIDCADGKARRWIYLKENEMSPVLDWLDPSYSALRLAAGDGLDSFYRLGQTIFCLDPKINSFAQDNLTLCFRKIGAYTVQNTNGGILGLKSGSGDLIFDTLTQAPLLHALLTGDAEALRLAYRLFLEAEIQPKRLVHSLQSMDKHSCDWSEFLLHPKKRYRYYEETLTGEVLRKRLLKEDLLRLGGNTSTSVGYCAASLNIKDFQKAKDQIEQAHLLLAFFYALQPGAFSFSLSDLLGALPQQSGPYDLLGCNETTLYPSLPIQLKNTYSFASGLKRILTARTESNIATAELIDVLPASSPGLLLLLHRTSSPPRLNLLAVNFSTTAVNQTIERPDFRLTNVINLLTNLAECKPFDSPTLLLHVPPLSSKSLLFLPKHYD